MLLVNNNKRINILAQGKAYTVEQREMIIESLRGYLELGFSRNKACDLTGLDPSTLSRWVTDDEALSMKLQSWENAINKLAMQNIVDAMRREAELPEDLRKENSWKWAERRIKELSPKSENEHIIREGKPLLDALHNNNSDKESSETTEQN